MAASLCMLFATNAAAFQHQQSRGSAQLVARSDSDQPALALADVLHVVITLKGSKELHVDTPVKPAAGSTWELLATSAATPSADADGQPRWQQTLTLAPTTPGEAQLQLTPLVFRDGSSEPQKIEWQPFTVVVRTQLAEVDPRQARDITAIEETPALPPAPGLSWLWLALPVVVIALAGLWLLRQRRIRPHLASALRKAMRECDRLLALQLPEKDRGKDFIVLLSGIVRRYLERRFDIPARRQTSAQLLGAIDARSDVSDEAKRWLHTFFAETDLIKYAGAAVDAERCGALADGVRHFCRAAAPLAD
jgi:hypothetical protein